MTTDQLNVAWTLNQPIRVMGMVTPGERDGQSLDALVSAANILLSDRNTQQQ
jgi:hypothetical protein